jgi:hypothetical protein
VKPTKKQVAEFVRLQQRLAIGAGFSLRHEDSLDMREYIKQTSPAGTIYCTPCGNWVAVRFADIEAAKRAGITPANDYSGKHNFHEVMTVDSRLRQSRTAGFRDRGGVDMTGLLTALTKRLTRFAPARSGRFVVFSLLEANSGGAGF